MAGSPSLDALESIRQQREARVDALQALCNRAKNRIRLARLDSQRHALRSLKGARSTCETRLTQIDRKIAAMPEEAARLNSLEQSILSTKELIDRAIDTLERTMAAGDDPED